MKRSKDTANVKDNDSEGNTYFPRETPPWQKPITNFFSKAEAGTEASTSNVSSSTSPPNEELNSTEVGHDDSSSIGGVAESQAWHGWASPAAKTTTSSPFVVPDSPAWYGWPSPVAKTATSSTPVVTGSTARHSWPSPVAKITTSSSAVVVESPDWRGWPSPAMKTTTRLISNGIAAQTKNGKDTAQEDTAVEITNRKDEEYDSGQDEDLDNDVACSQNPST